MQIMDCKNAELYMDALLDDELSVKDNLKVLSHIEACNSCRKKWDLNAETRTELKMYIGSIKAPKHLMKEVINKINVKKKSFYLRPAFVSACMAFVLSFGIFFNYTCLQFPQLHELHNIVDYQLISNDIELLSKHIGISLSKEHLIAFEEGMFSPHGAVNINRPFNKDIKMITLKNDKGHKISLCFLPKEYKVSGLDKKVIKGITVHHGRKNDFHFAYWENKAMGIALVSQDISSSEMIDFATPLINEV